VTIIPDADWVSRLLRATRLVSDRQREALIVLSLPNIRWLTGFSGSSGALILTAGWLYFITDFRYSRSVELLAAGGRLGPNVRIVTGDRGYDEAIVDTLASIGGGRPLTAGIEGEHVSVRRFQRLTSRAAAHNVTLEAVDPLIERLRMVKDASELSLVRDAAAKLSGIVKALPAFVRRGRTERTIALEIEDRLRRAGFEKPAFETIVASGPNSALPHARPSERELAVGDPVVLDFGGVHGGYCVDLTRTGSVGPPSAEFERMVAVTAEAQRAAIARVVPGADASAVDEAARQVFAKHGLGEAFGHATGHGLGLEVHELPRIGRRTSETEDAVLERGMVFTIEPGAYVPSIGGVRIEDDIAVTAAGADILTDIPRDLLVFGAE
jgi:Xaa-Pro aminopeptidase